MAHAVERASALYRAVGAEQLFVAEPTGTTHNLGTARMSARAGGEIARMPLGQAAEFRAGAPYWVIHRADLQAALHQDSADSDVFIPDTINLSKQAAPAKSSGGCC